MLTHGSPCTISGNNYQSIYAYLIFEDETTERAKSKVQPTRAAKNMLPGSYEDKIPYCSQSGKSLIHCCCRSISYIDFRLSHANLVQKIVFSLSRRMDGGNCMSSSYSGSHRQYTTGTLIIFKIISTLSLFFVLFVKIISKFIISTF